MHILLSVIHCQSVIANVVAYWLDRVAYWYVFRHIR